MQNGRSCTDFVGFCQNMCKKALSTHFPSKVNQYMCKKTVSAHISRSFMSKNPCFCSRNIPPEPVRKQNNPFLLTKWRNSFVCAGRSGEVRYQGAKMGLFAPWWLLLRDEGANTGGFAPPSAYSARRPFSRRSWAIWTALVAAPLRRLSATHQRLRPFLTEKSRRMRPTKTSSLPSAKRGIG